MQLTYSLIHINDIVQQVWEEGKKHKVWIFKAEMGSGKTTFIHALCNFLEVKDAVASPTFSIINEYKSAAIGTIYHMDWYRLKNEKEAINAGVEDALLDGNLCLVEWPEKAPQILSEKVFTIQLHFVDENERMLTAF